MAQVSAKKITLYYFPTSYSSQKVLLALYEKEVPFKPKLVSLFTGQHNEPWYVKLNPEGIHVPVIQDGDVIVNSPESIIEYIDQAADTGMKLLPDESSELGMKVKQFRKRLDNIEMDIITYGIIYHPHLSESGCRIPGVVQRSMRENFANRLSYLTELAAKHPALRDGYLAKSQTAAQKFDVITDAVQVQYHLESLKKVISDVEQQLTDIKEVSKDIADELWLFGPMFTAADISLTVLLSRLSLLGLDSYYFPKDSCPQVHNYYTQVQKRPAYQHLQTEIANIRLSLLWENVKTASPYVAGLAGIGMVAAGAFWFYNKSR
ncbi:hypothetical protein FSP39_024005 [Pinctada imbricata]|uniref:GST N-terminal domain-containing protein n=1 Tax=Pinctada imbricata TaxID=66713 RepID=A0AA88Y0I9_PINIB|nr:hypothetical protein FSP39_024005 [Pinctada imbricata]